FYLTAVDRHSRRIRQKAARTITSFFLNTFYQIIITTETDYTNNTSQIFVIFSYYYSVFTVVTFLFSKVLIADNSV
ncbi:hypothetical protein, partial [Escherichia coli]|uniref:hypothetical protein n=1 Tax=Escherichia coli TaxID=562 RepID=UPI0030C73519